MKKKILIIVSVLIACFAICFFIREVIPMNNSIQTETNQEDLLKSVGGTSWAPLTLKSMYIHATKVVCGTVSEVGESYLGNVQFEYTSPKRVYTPITINVSKWIKGDDGSHEVTYLANMGVAEGYISELDGTRPFEVGDNLFIFLYDDNTTMGPQGYYFTNANEEYEIPICMFEDSPLYATREYDPSINPEVAKILEQANEEARAATSSILSSENNVESDFTELTIEDLDESEYTGNVAKNIDEISALMQNYASDTN